MNIHAMKERLKRIFTPRVLTIGACAVAGLLICAGGYRLIRYSTQKREVVQHPHITIVTPRKTPEVLISPEPTSPPIPPHEMSQVLSTVVNEDYGKIEYHYEDNYINATLDGQEILRITFDEKGNLLTKMYRCTPRYYKSSDHYYLCEYDADDYLIKRSLYIKNAGNDLLVCTTVFYYDSNGKLADIQTKHADPLPIKDDSTYEANEYGILKKSYCPEGETIYNSYGNLIKYSGDVPIGEDELLASSFFYDDDHVDWGQMCIRHYIVWERELDTIVNAGSVRGNFFIFLEAPPHFSLSYEFLYDTNGHLHPASFFNGSAIVQPFKEEHVFTDSCDPVYNAAGKLIQCAHFRNDFMFWREYEFDENQRISKEIHHINTVGYEEANYEYDNNGKLLKIMIARGSRFKEEYLYNENGIICQYKRIYDDYNVVLDFVFDAEGRALMKKWTLNSDTERLPLQSAEYFYDAEFRQSGSQFSFPEENGGFSVHEYDENSLKRRESCYDKNGVLLTRKEYSYNEQGWMVRYDEYDASGVLIGWMEYHINDIGRRDSGIGRRIGWDYYTNEGKQFSDTERKRDELGRPIKITYREDRTEESRSVYEYDKNGCVNGYSDGVSSYTFTDVPEQVYALYARCNFDDLILTIQ